MAENEVVSGESRDGGPTALSSQSRTFQSILVQKCVCCDERRRSIASERRKKTLQDEEPPQDEEPESSLPPQGGPSSH
jgi:hypothetical protein